MPICRSRREQPCQARTARHEPEQDPASALANPLPMEDITFLAAWRNGFVPWPAACAEARPLPGTARDGIAQSSGRSAGWLSRSLSGAHWAVIARMSALPNWHHGGDWMRRTTRALRTGAKYIMSLNRGRHSANPNRPRHRSADAWATCAIPMPTPVPTGQIQAQLTNRRPLCRRKCSQSTGRNASKGCTSMPAVAIKRP